MQKLGPIEKFPELKGIFEVLTSGPTAEGKILKFAGGAVATVRRFHGKKINYLDWKGCRYVEQNPNTQSAYAARARTGAKIIWVIRLEDGQYQGCVEDGVVFSKQTSRNAYSQ